MTLEKDVVIKVRGKDMFGASFRENARVISIADSELCVSMWRPIAENFPIEVQFCDNESFWMWGQIIDVRQQLDGTQAVKVKLH